MSDDHGYALTELLVGIISFVVVFGAILMMTVVATRNQDRIAERVSANQRVRPVMTHIIDALHSGCVAQRVAPVLSGSTPTSISFVSKSGSSVSPTPDKRVVTLSGGDLTEQVYPAISGTAPSWTFDSTESSSRTLLTDVSAPGDVAFSYYDYVNGQLNSTPLPASNGLSTTDAARTAYVSVTLTAAPSGGASAFDPNSPITVSDAADLRLESASQITAQENPPCT